MIGYALCGSFCTFAQSLAAMKELVAQGEELLPIFSFNAATTDTRFGKADDFLWQVSDICGRSPILTIAGAEPLGPKSP